MAITASQVKELREMTGSGMMDCKKALTAAGGNIEKAVEWLREKGLATAQKKASRIAAEGISMAVVADNASVLLSSVFAAPQPAAESAIIAAAISAARIFFFIGYCSFLFSHGIIFF